MGGRTPLARKLGEAAAVAAREASAEEALGEPSPGMRRRELLAGGAGLAAAAMLSGPVSRALAASAPRVVVVGGGLAGLTAAYRLKQAGINAQLYEASDRLGGRCWTRRGDFAEGQIAEHGGELIDQGHTEIRQLAQELGLDLDNLVSAEVNGTDPFHYFDGQPYSYEEATNDLKGIWQQIHKDVSAASYPTLYNSSTQRGRELDAMSIADWIQAYVPGGLKSKLGQLLDVAYNIEYGAETNVQSSLNMLYLLGYSGQGQLRIFGPSNEKYHVRGGNDQIPARLAAELKGQITKERPLTSIKRNTDGTYKLVFESGLSTETVTADQVVLALPFSILRTLDYSKAGFSKVKTTAIEQMGMGTNSKLHVQFKDRLWNSLGCNGETYADTGYQNTWEVTRAQAGSSGILVDYTGGTIGASFGSGTPAERAAQFLKQIEPVLPGISSRWNGRATIDFWTGYQWTKGSYSYWKVGQYTKFAGAEREPEGNCHFAGEHTSIDFQGYLNGAVESGERAAGEILAGLK
ncbi:MAG TPA: NAD(P)/FAD-dependent oxidoreductase [Solirubrobacterales bacterium]|nr:NAD(P)/FAD-dependent oxidoreductase [Solirubrobacterales bacterium]